MANNMLPKAKKEGKVNKGKIKNRSSRSKQAARAEKQQKKRQRQDRRKKSF